MTHDNANGHQGNGFFVGGADAAVLVETSSSANRVYVSGYDSEPPPSGTVLTAALDQHTGKPIWWGRYAGRGFPSDMVLSSDESRMYVTIHEGRNYGTVAYDSATGEEIWSAIYDVHADVEDLIPTGIAINPEGSSVFITGYEFTCDPVCRTGHATTVAYEAATGQQLWVRRGDPWFVANDIGSGPGTDTQGRPVDRAYIVGASSVLALHGRTGEVIWSSEGPLNCPLGCVLRVSPDGSSIYVMGGAGGNRFETVALESASGRRLWRAVYMSGQLEDAQAMELSLPGDRVFVSGRTWTASPRTSAFRTLAYDAQSGGLLWEARYEPAGYNWSWPFDLAVSADGHHVYATGYAANEAVTGIRAAFATVAYDATTGTQQWTSLFGHQPANHFDVANSVATGRQGGVFVAGHFGNRLSLDNWSDWGVLRYEA